MAKELQEFHLEGGGTPQLADFKERRNRLTHDIEDAWKTLTQAIEESLHRNHGLDMEVFARECSKRMADEFRSYTKKIGELDRKLIELNQACDQLEDDVRGKMTESCKQIANLVKENRALAMNMLIHFARGLIIYSCAANDQKDCEKAYRRVSEVINTMKGSQDPALDAAGAEFDSAVAKYMRISQNAALDLKKAFSFLYKFGEENKNGYKKKLFTNPADFSWYCTGVKPVVTVLDMMFLVSNLLLALSEARVYVRETDFRDTLGYEKGTAKEFLDAAHANNIRVVKPGTGDYAKLKEALDSNWQLIPKRAALMETVADELGLQHDVRAILKRWNAHEEIQEIDEFLREKLDMAIFDAAQALEYRANILELTMLSLTHSHGLIEDLGGDEIVSRQSGHGGQNSSTPLYVRRLHDRLINDIRRASQSFRDCSTEAQEKKLSTAQKIDPQLQIAVLNELQYRFDDFDSQLVLMKAEMDKLAGDGEDPMLKEYISAIDGLIRDFKDAKYYTYCKLRDSKTVILTKELRQQAREHFNRSFESPEERASRERQAQLELDKLIEAEEALSKSKAQFQSAQAPSKGRGKQAPAPKASSRAEPSPQAGGNSATDLRKMISIRERNGDDEMRWLIGKYEESRQMMRMFADMSPINMERECEWAIGYLKTALEYTQTMVSLYKKLQALPGGRLSEGEAQRLLHHEKQIETLTELERGLSVPRQERINRARQLFRETLSPELFHYLHEQKQFAVSDDAGRGFEQSDVSYSGRWRHPWQRDWIEERPLRFKIEGGKTEPVTYAHVHYNHRNGRKNLAFKPPEPEQRFNAFYNGEETYHSFVDMGVGDEIGKEGNDAIKIINNYLRPEHRLPFTTDRQPHGQ